MKKRENPVIQRVSDPFDDLVMDSNKSLKSIYKGSRRNGVRMAKRKKGMTFIPYDYEAAYNKSLEDMNEFFVEQMFKHGKKVDMHSRRYEQETSSRLRYIHSSRKWMKYLRRVGVSKRTMTRLKGI